MNMNNIEKIIVFYGSVDIALFITEKYFHDAKLDIADHTD